MADSNEIKYLGQEGVEQLIELFKAALNGVLPTITSDDNGKFLRAVDGFWEATSVPNAEEATF